MLLLFIVPLLSIFVSANPFHKYPFVFLLDIGNEELEKTHTEQIRLAIPGGSLAVRYPAIGDGDTIAHVRVSGIDFGNDLKAAIYDGGPGSKYVVLVFKGNPGVPYDAVVTLQTVPSDEVYDGNGQGTVDSGGENILKDSETVSSEGNAYQRYEDPNDSSEDTSDSVTQYSKKTNEELIQSSPSQHNYAINKPSDKNTHKDYQASGGENNQNVEVKDYIEYVDIDGDNGEEGVSNYENEVDNDFETEKSNSNTDDKVIQEENGEEVRIADSNLYDKYEAMWPHLYDNVKVYPQGSVHDKQAQEPEGQSGYEDDPIEVDQMFNDEEVHNNADKNKDSNNNYYDTDDSSAVAS